MVGTAKRAAAQFRGLFSDASAARKRISRARRAAKAAHAKVARAAAAEARRRRAEARKVSKARRVARRGAAKAARAGRKIVRAARKGLKRYSALHKSGVKAVGSKSEVFKGLAKHTAGGLKKKDIVRKVVGRRGKKTVYRYMSKKKASAGKRRGLPKALKAWRSALRRVGAKGVPKKGTAAYAAAKAEFAKIMRKSAPAGGAAKVASRRRRTA
jgi:hypothetical protein